MDPRTLKAAELIHARLVDNRDNDDGVDRYTELELLGFAIEEAELNDGLLVEVNKVTA